MDAFINDSGLQLPLSISCDDCKDSKSLEITIIRRNSCLSCIKRDVLLSTEIFSVIAADFLKQKIVDSDAEILEKVEAEEVKAESAEDTATRHSSIIITDDEYKDLLKDAVIRVNTRYYCEIAKGPGPSRIFVGGCEPTEASKAAKFVLRAAQPSGFENASHALEGNNYGFFDQVYDCYRLREEYKLSFSKLTQDLYLARTLCCPAKNEWSLSISPKLPCRLHNLAVGLKATSIIPLVEVNAKNAENICRLGQRQYDSVRDEADHDVEVFIKLHGAPRPTADHHLEKLLRTRMDDLGMKQDEFSKIPESTIKTLTALSFVKQATSVMSLTLRELRNEQTPPVKKEEKKQPPKKQTPKSAPKDKVPSPSPPKTYAQHFTPPPPQWSPWGLPYNPPTFQPPQYDQQWQQVNNRRGRGGRNNRQNRKVQSAPSSPEGPKRQFSDNPQLIAALKAMVGDHQFDLRYARTFWNGKTLNLKGTDKAFFEKRVIKDF